VAKPHGRRCPIPKFANDSVSILEQLAVFDRVKILHLVTGDGLFFYPQVRIR
jgi:hypothetical protein